MNIDVNRVFELKRELDEINKAPLEEMVFIRNGEEISASPLLVDEWKSIGLTNFYFILTNFVEVIEE